MPCVFKQNHWILLACTATLLSGCFSSESIDSDTDGILDHADNCPLTANPNQTDTDGDGIGDVCDPQDNADNDNDGVQNFTDNCPDIANDNQADSDGDEIGDACDTQDNGDADNDGIQNFEDNCPATANPNQADLDNDNSGDACDTEDNRDNDNDGVQNFLDNCPNNANPDQNDSDSDRIGDVCDTQDNSDADNDGVANFEDNCLTDANPDQADADGDNIGDVCDGEDNGDADSDGVENFEDNCPNDTNPDQADTDGDDIGDACDPVDNTSIGMLTISNLNVAQSHVLPPQGKQWMLNSGQTQDFHMVGNRAALAVFDVGPNGAQNLRVLGQNNGTSLGTVVVQPNTNLPPSEDGGPRYSNTAQFATLPANWLQPGLRLRLVADNADPSLWENVSVGADPDFTILSLPFFLFGADASLVSTDPAMPSSSQINEIFALWPVTTMNVLNHPAGQADWPELVIAPRGGNPAYRMSNSEDRGADGFAPISGVLQATARIRLADGNRNIGVQYYGSMVQADSSGNFAGTGGGLGTLGGHQGAGNHTYTGIFIHEQGHAFGMPHSGENFDAGGDYPYPGGSLSGSVWGYDQVREQFMPTLVPATARRFTDCENDTFNGTSRQLDGMNRCIRQDPMQSGAADRSFNDNYSIFSDFNAGFIQRYFEGIATIEPGGGRSYSGGRVFPTSNFPTGYQRWDSIDRAWIAYDPTIDPENGRFGVNNGFPSATNVSVYTIVFTRSNTNTPDATYIYPPLGPYTGNLIRTFDPNLADDRTDITPNTGTHPWYCRSRGCDFTLRVTYDSGVRDVVVQGGFRSFFDETGPVRTGGDDPNDSRSYAVYAINVPNDGAIQQIELLDTPTVWNGLPAEPIPVLATFPEP